MTTINVPTRQEVSSVNQAIFDNLEKRFGVVPNLFATMAHSGNALASYMALQSAKSTISGKAREVVNLVVSQVNECEYCLAAHTMVGKMSGFSDEQIIEIRRGRASFDSKLDALARLAQGIAQSRGHVDPAAVEAFFAANWTKENLVDTIVAIGDKTVTNYLHSTTRIPVDFPAAPVLE
ncbi:Alkylhydroperoxidase like protein, AhpD family (plasmid) [Pararobbsia alpina]|uniref:carboxymuconolactone decarboxylase family protein n=1 Tax=Pararobbsia alpina TaxID=621374 RepID=UPI0039A574DE